MNKICKACIHLEKEVHGDGLQCSMNVYKYNEGYGPFRQGAQCKHEGLLEDLFEPITEGGDQLQKYATDIEKKKREISELGDEVTILRSRLVSIGEEK